MILVFVEKTEGVSSNISKRELLFITEQETTLLKKKKTIVLYRTRNYFRNRSYDAVL